MSHHRITLDELENELLHISPLPTIMSPLPEPDEALPVSLSLYREPSVPDQPDPAPIKCRVAVYSTPGSGRAFDD